MISPKLYAIVQHMHKIGKYENEQHFHNIMWYAYGFHLAITNEELVELTWYAVADGYWSPEIHEAYLEFHKKEAELDTK